MDDLKTVREIFRQSLPVFNALGDSVRQQLILFMLEPGSKSVGELAAKTSLSRPTVSHHLKILREANLIGERRVGTKRFYEPIIVGVEEIQKLTDEVKRLQNNKKEG